MKVLNLILVILMLSSYSEVIAQNDSRQQMLLASIRQLYNQPHIYSEKKGSVFSFNTRHLKEAVDSLKEAVNQANG